MGDHLLMELAYRTRLTHARILSSAFKARSWDIGSLASPYLALPGPWAAVGTSYLVSDLQLGRQLCLCGYSLATQNTIRLLNNFD